MKSQLITLTDNPEGFVNTVTARGPGTGINRPTVTLQNELSITEYGEREVVLDFPSAVDLQDLTDKAQEALDKLSDPAQHQTLSVEVHGMDRPIFQLGQTVRVSDAALGISITTKVQELDSTETSTVLHLGAPPVNLLDILNEDEEEERNQLALGLPPPIGLRAIGQLGSIDLLLNPFTQSRAVGVEVHLGTTRLFEADRSTLAARGSATRFAIGGLTVGKRYWLKARSYDDRGNLSDWSEEVSAVPRYMNPEEVDPDTAADIAYSKVHALVVEESRHVWDRSEAITADRRILRGTLEDSVQQELTDMTAGLGAVESGLLDAQGRLDAAEGSIDLVDGRLTTAEINITNIDGELASKADASVVDTIAGTVSDHSTAIVQNANEIASKADATVVDTLAGTVSSHSTSISQNASEIASKADASVVDSLAGTVSNHSTQITQNATDISQRATVTQFNQLTGQVDSHDTLIQQNATDILARATSAELGAVEDDLSAAVTRINTAEVAINAHGVSIEAVESSVDDLGDDLVNAWAAIDVTSTSITSTVAKLGLAPGHVEQFSSIRQLSTNLSFVVADVSGLHELVESIESGYALEPMTTVNGEAMTTVGGVAMTTSVVQGLAAVFTAIAMNQNQIDMVASASADHYSLIQQNASAITQRVTQGAFNTTVTQLSDQISQRVTNSVFSSTINQLSDEIDFKVDADGVITALNLSPEGAKINASKVGILTGDNIGLDSITADKILNGTITGVLIEDGAITANKIQAGAITTEKLTAGTLDLTNSTKPDARMRVLNTDNSLAAELGHLTGPGLSGRRGLRVATGYGTANRGLYVDWQETLFGSAATSYSWNGTTVLYGSGSGLVIDTSAWQTLSFGLLLIVPPMHYLRVYLIPTFQTRLLTSKARRLSMSNGSQLEARYNVNGGAYSAPSNAPTIWYHNTSTSVNRTVVVQTRATSEVVATYEVSGGDSDEGVPGVDREHHVRLLALATVTYTPE